MSNPLGESVADLLEGISQPDAVTEELRQSQNEQVLSMQQEILASMAGKKNKQEYPKEVSEIASALTAQPLLIAPVQAFLARLVQSINQAQQDAIAQVLNQAPTQ